MLAKAQRLCTDPAAQGLQSCLGLSGPGLGLTAARWSSLACPVPENTTGNV